MREKRNEKSVNCCMTVIGKYAILHPCVGDFLRSLATYLINIK